MEDAESGIRDAALGSTEESAAPGCISEPAAAEYVSEPASGCISEPAAAGYVSESAAGIVSAQAAAISAECAAKSADRKRRSRAFVRGLEDDSTGSEKGEES